MINMKALIASNEQCSTGYRVAQVEANENIFPVAESLFWVDCGEDVVADLFWYDPQDQTIKPVVFEHQSPNNKPTVEGAQTL